jgi:hypothetical protein
MASWRRRPEVTMNGAIRGETRDRDSANSFLRALAEDVRTAGGHASVSRRDGRLRFAATLGMDSESLLFAAERMRERQRSERRLLVQRAVRRGLAEMLECPPDFDPRRISPRLVLCESRKQHDLFSYAKLAQSVPSAPRAGRRLRFLVFDQAARDALIGVIELASPVFALACRDAVFGFTASEGQDRRVPGLRHVMDLSTCLASPTYATLRAGKLLAMLAASADVAGVFQSRYGERLAAVVATCATGLHYPQLNRLTIRLGGLYRRIGATAGYSTWLFSRETLLAARVLVYGDSARAASFGADHVKAIRLIRSALRRVGLDAERFLRTDLPKGVYLCDVPGDGVQALQLGREPEGRPILFDAAVSWWRLNALSPILDRAELSLWDDQLTPQAAQSLGVT